MITVLFVPRADMAAYAADITENSYEIDSEYDENFVDVEPGAIEIAWRHYRTASASAVARYGLPLDRNGDAASDIPLEKPGERRAYDLSREHFDKFANGAHVYMRISTMCGTIFIFKAPSLAEKFLVMTTPDISPIGEILYFNYINA